MNWDALVADLEWQYREHPGKARLLIDAARQVQAGLSLLAAHGHSYRVEAGSAPYVEYDWPRVYYHFDLGPRVVGSPGQLAEMGGAAGGWHTSPSAAAWAYGEDVQFAGRGGVRRQRGLAMVGGAHSDDVPLDGPTREEMKAQFLREKHEREARTNGKAAG